MPESKRELPRQILVLQGGGALGSYQAGVHEGLCDLALEPDWVCGISIGAINAALIAGNPPERRLERLRTFWDLTTSGGIAGPMFDDVHSRGLFSDMSATWAALTGAPGFFRPRFISPFFYPPGAPEALSFYDTEPLRETLLKLVDFDLINSKKVRLSVGAVNIRTGKLRFFDNNQERIGPEHNLASGALPPGLPPVVIDGESYWDGGLVSNTPLDYVFVHDQVDDLVIFQVDLFRAAGALPRSIVEANEREKEIRFASRTRRNTQGSDAAAQGQGRRARPDRQTVGRALGRPRDRGVALKAFARENSVTIVQLVLRRARL